MDFMGVTVYVLNLFDLFCTLNVMRLGVREGNPFMRSLPVMIFHKVVTVGVLLWWISTRPEQIAKKGLRACAATYAVLAAYHCFGIFKILS